MGKPFDYLVALADGIDAPDERLLAAVETEVVPSDEAVVIFTSGSTAKPKAVIHCHWTLARHSPVLAAKFALRCNDRMMCLLPLFWLAAMSTMLQVLSVGATQVYPRSTSRNDALTMISDYGVTRVNAWGARQPGLIEAAKRDGVDLSGNS